MTIFATTKHKIHLRWPASLGEEFAALPDYLRACGVEPSLGRDGGEHTVEASLPADWTLARASQFEAELNRLCWIVARASRYEAQLKQAAGGFAEQILRQDDAECPAYVPTRSELKQLARHLAQVSLDNRLFYFYYAQSSYADILRDNYTRMRLKRLAEVIGEDAVSEEEQAVGEEARRRLGPDLWRAFTRGGDGERSRVLQDDAAREGDLRRRGGEPTKDVAFAFLRENPSRVFIDGDGFLWRLHDDTGSGKPREDLLTLGITSPAGGSAFVYDRTIPRPAGWVPPYGMR